MRINLNIIKLEKFNIYIIFTIILNNTKCFEKNKFGMYLGMYVFKIRHFQLCVTINYSLYYIGT